MDHILYYLELSSNPIRFDSVSQLTNVFFDDSNRQVKKKKFLSKKEIIYLLNFLGICC